MFFIFTTFKGTYSTNKYTMTTPRTPNANQYAKFKAILEVRGWPITISLEQYLETGRIQFLCKENHPCDLSFTTKEKGVKCGICSGGRYTNWSKRVTDAELVLITTRKEFESAPEPRPIAIRCQYGHVREYVETSFLNLMNKRGVVCVICEAPRMPIPINKKRRITYGPPAEHIVDMNSQLTNGKVVISYTNAHNVLYRCTCGKEMRTSFANILKSTKGCNQCAQVPTEEKIDDVRSKLEEYGMELVGDYKNNKGMPVKCVCGEEWKASLNDIKRGRKCMKCGDTAREETFLRLYGTTGFADPEGFKKFMLTRYGSEYFITSDTYKKRMQELYGVDHHMQHPETFQKCMETALRLKQFSLPKTGRVVEVMGYEQYAIELLLEKVHPLLGRPVEEDEILTGPDVPRFAYADENGQKRRYFPDIAIKDTNIIIEVKSIWTLNYKPQRNYHKFLGVSALNHICQVMVFKNQSTLCDTFWFHPNQNPQAKCQQVLEKLLKNQKTTKEDYEMVALDNLKDEVVDSLTE